MGFTVIFHFLKKFTLVFTGVGCLVSCSKHITDTYIGEGWSKNSVNTVKFRKNALTTHSGYQFVAYYNGEGYLVLGKRAVGTPHWQTEKTRYKGNAKDAHNAISIVIDGDGFLHVSWDHHNTRLRYAKSKTPLSLDLGMELSMTGNQEDKVTYPEFYNLPNGNVLFFYRSGESGRGNLVINSYDVKAKKWSQVQSNLIDGEGNRSAYWQATVDASGTVHLSWTWRETWGVETNHDICYAKSTDGGITWERTTGEGYVLPITLATAEYAWEIPQGSNLINQTAMCTDAVGNPYIVSYWNSDNIPQYQIVYLEGGRWRKMNTAFRGTPFSLGGGGTKAIPISRPDILLMGGSKNRPILAILFRDRERGDRVSLAYSVLNGESTWEVIDLNAAPVGAWEPNYDISLWNSHRQLHVFVQDVAQVDGEGLAETKPSQVKIIEVKDLRKLIAE